MLFQETLAQLQPEVELAVDELFSAIDKNQVHPQDVLLAQWGSYSPGFAGFKPFGPGLGGWEHHAEHTQYEFYDFYRRQLETLPRTDVYSKAEASEDLMKSVRLSIQMELMVYLRFWETDRLLTKLYHYTQLALGKQFNWQYRIAQDDSRQELIRLEIRDSLQTACPRYYALLKKMYRSQIRNAVAHSQYYVVGNRIGFTNNTRGTYANLTQESFVWWEDIFHTVILFYNELLKHQLEVDERAKRQDKLSLGAGIQVRYTDPSLGKEDLVYWTFNYDRKIWDWAPPRTQSGLFI